MAAPGETRKVKSPVSSGEYALAKRKHGTAGSDDLADVETCVFDRSSQAGQLFIAFERLQPALFKSQRTEMAVVVVQPPERLSGIRNRVHHAPTLLQHVPGSMPVRSMPGFTSIKMPMEDSHSLKLCWMIDEHRYRRHDG